MTTLSIIVPAYNVADYIPRTLRSILSQNHPRVEVIVVDDGATDNTAQVVREVLRADGAGNAALYNKENGGVSSARNHGLDLATGEYVLFLDGDDYLEQGFVEVFLAVVDAHHPDVLHWPYDQVDEHSRVTAAFPHQPPVPAVRSGAEVLQAMLLEKTTRMCTISMACRRLLLLEHGLRFTENCWYGEDAEFIFKAVAAAETVLFVPQLKSLYVQRSNSAMERFTVRRFDAVSAMQRVRNHLAGLPGEAFKRLTAHFDSQVVLHYYAGTYRLCLQHRANEERGWYRKAMQLLDSDIDSAYPGLRQQMNGLLANRKRGTLPDRLGVFRVSPWLYMRLSQLPERLNRLRKG